MSAVVLSEISQRLKKNFPQSATEILGISHRLKAKMVFSYAY